VARWNFSTRELHPRGAGHRWAVYVDGQLVGIKRTTFHSCGPRMPKAMSTTQAELVLLTPAGRRWGGDPKATHKFAEVA